MTKFYGREGQRRACKTTKHNGKKNGASGMKGTSNHERAHNIDAPVLIGALICKHEVVISSAQATVELHNFAGSASKCTPGKSQFPL